MLPVLDEDTVRVHLQWDVLIAAMENALIASSAGRVQQPVRRLLFFRAGKNLQNAGYGFGIPACAELVERPGEAAIVEVRLER